METGDGTRAWLFLRRIAAYRTAWKKRLPQPGLPERAPFPNDVAHDGKPCPAESGWKFPSTMDARRMSMCA